MSVPTFLIRLAALVLGGALFGCAPNEIGNAPVVKVSAAQRAKDLDAEAESTVKWLEGMTPESRTATIAKLPQVKATLSNATDPALKSRIAALGL